MIICHCMTISDHDVRAAVNWMRAADTDTIITPGKVFRALGKRADCGGCLPLFLATMTECDTMEVPMNLRRLRRAPPQGTTHEGRHEGHRVSERGSPV